MFTLWHIALIYQQSRRNTHHDDDDDDCVDALLLNDDKCLSDLFESAASCVRSSTSSIDADNLLYLYARYKLINDGCYAESTQSSVGIFDIQSRRKLNAWAQLGAMTKECAMRQYINRVHRLNIGLTTKTPPQAFGLRISRPIVVNDVDDDSIWFKSIKDGNYDAIREMMTNEDVIDSRDDLGMNALHWAVDRGDYRLTSLLLECPLIDVNAQDNEGQTALHIATACDHTSIIKLLIDAGADVNIVDVHGNVAQHHK